MSTTLLVDPPPASPADAAWTVDEAEALYRLRAWGDRFFSVNAAGHIAVTPLPNTDLTVDLYRIVGDLRKDGTPFPVLVRFQDILETRVVQLNEAFAGAIEEADYEGRYTGVYPIKVNQLREVVEEVLEAGQRYGMGLECGSKAELVAALPYLESDEMLLICNGYKDASMQRLILMAQRLGKRVIPVIEKYDEFERLLALARELDVTPRFGVRVQLTTRGAGKWAESAGDGSKFGVTIAELLRILDRLVADDMPDAFHLLHFHLGSQIANIQTLKRAVKESAQVYAQLRQRGIDVRYVDVGGGLGVNYEAAFRGQDDSINYTLQEYANAIVYTVKDICAEQGVPVPTLVSESGRALTAHHSVLIVEVLGAYQKGDVAPGFTAGKDDHAVVRGLYDTLLWVRGDTANGRVAPYGGLLEAYHDATEKRQEARSLFSFGYLPLEQKALAESLYWTICRTIYAQVEAAGDEDIPTELRHLERLLIDQYLCDFSVFQSLLDHWAIGQRFPILPIHRLDEEPTRRAVLVDLTCDSDGKVSDFISAEGRKRYLETHALREGEPYFLGFFLMGAYQDIMGDAHNLFGRVTEAHVYADAEEPSGYYVEKMIPGATVREMLTSVQYSATALHRQMEQIIRKKVAAGVIRARDGALMLERYDDLFKQHTYLNPLDV